MKTTAEDVEKRLAEVLKSLQPIKDMVKDIEGDLSGHNRRRLIRDVELSKLMFKRIRSFSDLIAMDDKESSPRATKAAANISKMARETLTALEGETSDAAQPRDQG